ncbi:sarcosine oxidase subunit gamma [Candidatus Pelagibacter sp.]|nr:sarcosine oxidase subunit gamma [Candidatus Pelagibacter sp.]
MLNYNLPLTKIKKYDDLKVEEISPIMKINIRGKNTNLLTNGNFNKGSSFFAIVGKATNLILPSDNNTSSANEKMTSLWLGPDEWMIVSNHKNDKDNNIYETEEFLFNNISKAKLGSITNVTDQFVMINIEGKKVFDLLEASCPFNFNDFKQKKGVVIQTILQQIEVIIYHQEINSINLFVRRSYYEHLMSWIDDSASRL